MFDQMRGELERVEADLSHSRAMVEKQSQEFAQQREEERKKAEKKVCHYAGEERLLGSQDNTLILIIETLEPPTPTPPPFSDIHTTLPSAIRRLSLS